MTDPDMRSRDVNHDARPDRRPVRDEDLDVVNGGGRRIKDFVIVHKYDKASPVLI